MKLIDSEIKAARPKDKPYKLSDGGGLFLLVQPNRSKWWRYRYRFGGRENTISFGVYPSVTLKEARAKQEAAKELLQKKINPSAHRQETKQQTAIAAANSFEAVARLWWNHWKQTKSKNHTNSIIELFERDVFPLIGNKPVIEITAPMLIVVVKKIESRGTLDTARRTLGKCGQILRYAVAHGLAERNPAADIRPSDVLKPIQKAHYARLDERDLPELLNKIDSYTGSVLTILAMQLLALTFVRTNELIGARWDEIEPHTRRAHEDENSAYCAIIVSGYCYSGKDK